MNRNQVNKIVKLLIPVTSEILGAPKHSDTLVDYLKHESKGGVIAFYEDINPGAELKIPEFFAPKNKLFPQSYYTAKLKNARVWGRNGAVISDDDYFLNDVSREFDEGKNVGHSVFYTLRQVKAKRLQGNIAVIGTAGAYVYYHWMLDILPRLEILSRQISLNEIDYFITEYTGLPFQIETLENLGIPVEKIIPANENWNFHVKASTLYVPSLVGPIGQPTLFQINFLKGLYADCVSNQKPFRKIYISRRKTGRREIVNEKELIAFLSSYDFEIFYFEELPVMQQVLIFSEALIVISSHGSVFTNLVFSKPGTIVIDIFNETHTNPCFWIIAQYVGLNYYYFSGKSVPLNQNPKSDNTVINMEQFKNFFHRIGAGEKIEKK